MPTTRAAQREAQRAARCLTEVLPADALGLVLYQLTLAHEIAAVAPTNRAASIAARLALKARPFSGDVVTLLHGYPEQERSFVVKQEKGTVHCVAVAPDGRVITGSGEGTVKVWRDGVCERTIQVSDRGITAVVALPDGVRFITCSGVTATLCTLDGALERTFVVHRAHAHVVAALPDGVHFVVGLCYGWMDGGNDVQLYHIDGTLVHTFKGHASGVYALTVTRDGQHIISGSHDGKVKVWSVASQSLVSTCRGYNFSGGYVMAVAAMPDGKRILNAEYPGGIGVWQLDGTLERTFRDLHKDVVSAIVTMPDNQHALSGAGPGDPTIKLFDVNDGAVLRTFGHHGYPGAITSLALLPDGLRFVSGSYDNTARIAYHGLAPQ